MKLVLLLAATAVSLRVLLTEEDPPKAGNLNVTTGKIELYPSKFPPPPSGCTGWNLGGNGTKGQTFTTFDINGSWLVLAEGTGCRSSIPTIALIDMIGPAPPSMGLQSRIRAVLSTTSALSDMSASWDYTCNVVVVSREAGSEQVRFKTNQVSFYDGQQRMQADYKTEPVTCTDCWRKVAGLGGIDPGAFAKPYEKGDMEWYCGDSCVFYSIEEQLVEGKIVLPRQLVGRSFRTAQLMVNISDSFQIQTMTYVPSLLVFLGIGRCCQESWCDSACKGIPEQDLVIFQYVPKTQSLSFKAHLGPETGDDPASTIRLGVETTFQFSHRSAAAFVMYDGKVISYDLKSFVRSDVFVKSPQFIGAWAQGRPMD